MIPSRSWLDNERGFTLAELLVAAAMLALVMAGVLAIQRGGQHAYLLGSNRVETQQNARVALDLMTRELRTAQSVSNGLTNCTNCNCTSGTPDITFVDQNGQTIRYACSGNALNRSVNGVATALIGGVQSLTLTAYSTYDVSSSTYTATTCGTAVSLPSCPSASLATVIKINMVTKTEEAMASGLPGDQHSKMESMIRLRATLS
jgi:prepilin-type N-terminal cleavage/methylation domain-containing protein